MRILARGNGQSRGLCLLGRDQSRTHTLLRPDRDSTPRSHFPGYNDHISTFTAAVLIIRQTSASHVTDISLLVSEMANVVSHSLSFWPWFVLYVKDVRLFCARMCEGILSQQRCSQPCLVHVSARKFLTSDNPRHSDP